MKYVTRLHISWHEQAQITSCKAFSQNLVYHIFQTWTSTIQLLVGSERKFNWFQQHIQLQFKSVYVQQWTVTVCKQLNTSLCVTCHSATRKSDDQKLTKSVDPSSTTPLVVGTHTMVCNNNKVLNNPIYFLVKIIAATFTWWWQEISMQLQASSLNIANRAQNQVHQTCCVLSLPEFLPSARRRRHMQAVTES